MRSRRSTPAPRRGSDERRIQTANPTTTGQRLHCRTTGRDHIGRLLRLAGPREAVPADRMGAGEGRGPRRVASTDACPFPEDAIGWSLGAFAAAALLLLGVRWRPRRPCRRVPSPRAGVTSRQSKR